MTDLIKQNKAGGNLIKYQKPITFYGDNVDLIELTPAENNYLKVINSEKIKNIQFKELVNLVEPIVLSNLRAISSNMKSDDIAMLVIDFTNELGLEFPELTIAEFDHIVKYGIRGKYKSDLAGLSIVNFHSWHKNYRENVIKHSIAIQQKLIRQRSLEESPEKVVDRNDLISVLRSNYISLERKFMSKPHLITWEAYWIKNGLAVSGEYLFNEFLKRGVFTEKQFEQELKKVRSEKKEYQSNSNRLSDLMKKNTPEVEAKRIICCNYALKLAKQKTDKE